MVLVQTVCMCVSVCVVFPKTKNTSTANWMVYTSLSYWILGLGHEYRRTTKYTLDTLVQRHQACPTSAKDELDWSVLCKICTRN